MADKSGVDTFIAGFLIGGVVGAGLALLFAPASGRETREYLGRQAGQALDEGKHEIDKIRNIIQVELAKLAETKESLKEAIQKGSETYKSRKQGEIN